MAEDKELNYLTDDEAMFAVISQDNFIMLKKQLNFALGINENIIFTELLSKYRYYKQRNMLTEDGYFFCTAPDLFSSTSLNEKHQTQAIITLCEKGLIDKQLKGVPARRFFKITATGSMIMKLVKEGEKKINELLEQIEKANKKKVDKRQQSMNTLSEQKHSLSAENGGEACSAKMEELGEIKASEEIDKELSTDEAQKDGSSSAKMEELVPPNQRNWFSQNGGTGSAKMEELVPPNRRSNKTISNNTNNNIIEEDKEINNPSSFSSIELWNKVISFIKLNTNVQEVTFNTWIKPLGIKGHNEHSITLLAPNEFTQGILKARFIDQIIQPAVKIALGRNMDIKVEVGNLEEEAM